MKFKEVFGKYKNLSNLSQAAIARESGLTPSVVSRYAKGDRTPPKNSKSLATLSDVFYNSLKSQNIEIDPDTILSEFKSCEEYNDNSLSENLDRVLTKYDIKTASLAKALSLDNSFVNRVRNGIRNPKNVEEFIEKTCRFIADSTPEAKYEELLSEFNSESVSVKTTKSNSKKTKAISVKADTEKKDSIENTPGILSTKASVSASSRRPLAKKTSPSKDPGFFDMIGSILNPNKKSGKNKRSKRRR